MKILITGAGGFVGRNLCAALGEIQSGHDRRQDHVLRENPADIVLYPYDLNNTAEELDKWCAECDFVFNLAGVNRPEDPAEFIAAALAPADVLEVMMAEEGKSCRVIVPDDQLSLAIGKEGQNARLAARLTGYKIDIKPEHYQEEDAAEETV